MDFIADAYQQLFRFRFRHMKFFLEELLLSILRPYQKGSLRVLPSA